MLRGGKVGKRPGVSPALLESRKKKTFRREHVDVLGVSTHSLTVTD